MQQPTPHFPFFVIVGFEILSEEVKNVRESWIPRDTMKFGRITIPEPVLHTSYRYCLEILLALTSQHFYQKAKDLREVAKLYIT